MLELTSWTIFLTNLGPEVSFNELLETYGLRWRIEVIFKAWKSQMNFHVIHRVSALELKICLMAKLVSITVWLMESAPESSPTCIVLRKYCCYDQRKRLNYHQKQRALCLT